MVPDNRADGEDGEDDDGRTYQDYRREKARADLHDDHDAPRSPAEDPGADGPGSGFEDVLEDDGKTAKSAQEALESIDWDPLGADPVEKDDDEARRVNLSRQDIEEARKSPDERREDLLRQQVGLLHRLNRAVESGGSLTREDIEKAVGDSRAADRWAALLAGDEGDVADEDPAELLERVEDELERQEGKAESAKTAAEQYIEEEDGDLSDSLSEFVSYVRGAMPDSDDLDDEGNEARRRALAAFASLENTARDDGSLA